MTLKKHGSSISKRHPEVQNVSNYGVWLYVQGKEYFLDYERHPWFRGATIEQISHVKLLHGSHLYWPALDVDIELESLETPERYPLIYR